MANYYYYSLLDVTNPKNIGTGLGDTKDTVHGVDRICVSLEGDVINQDLLQENDEDTQRIKASNWIALTPECAKRLYEFLGALKHIWEKDETENTQYCGGCNNNCDECQVKADDAVEYDKDKECDGDCENCEWQDDEDMCPDN